MEINAMVNTLNKMIKHSDPEVIYLGEQTLEYVNDVVDGLRTMGFSGEEAEMGIAVWGEFMMFEGDQGKSLEYYECFEDLVEHVAKFCRMVQGTGPINAA